MANKKPLSRGDVIKITWADTTEDITGNPDAAAFIERITYGLYWAEKEDRGLKVLVTTTTVDPHGPDQQGYVVYPSACVLKIEVIKRAK